jgi:uncharacterized protein
LLHKITVARDDDVPDLDWKGGKLAEGLRLYRAQQYFEAHEQWEAVWLRLDGAEKTFVQAMIQLTAALHHYQNANRSGAKTLLAAVRRRLDETNPEIQTGVEHWLAALESGRVDADEPPAAILHLAMLDRPS